MKALVLIAAGLVALCSCHSPLEIDTPRDKTYDSIPDPGTPHNTTPPPRAVARDITVTFSGDNSFTFVEYDDVWTLMEIDTSGTVPAVWLRGTCTLPTGSSMFLRELTLRIDSMAANGTTVEIVGPPETAEGARLEVGDGLLPNQDLVAGQSGTKLEMQIAKAGAKLLEGTIHIETVFNSRAIQLEGIITIAY